MICTIGVNDYNPHTTTLPDSIMKMSKNIIIPEGLSEVLLHACCAPCSSAIVEWMLSHDIRPVIFKADVYNLAGMRIGSFRSDETFDLSGQPDGTYIVSWQYGGRSHSTKFIK